MQHDVNFPFNHVFSKSHFGKPSTIAAYVFGGTADSVCADRLKCGTIKGLHAPGEVSGRTRGQPRHVAISASIQLGRSFADKISKRICAHFRAFCIFKQKQVDPRAIH